MDTFLKHMRDAGLAAIDEASARPASWESIAYSAMAERDRLYEQVKKLREALKEVSEALYDTVEGKGGWAVEEVLDSARAALKETE